VPGEAFFEAYAKDMDSRVLADPHEAVGGLWDELGPLQFAYLCDNGLRPENRFLDVGCGTLRAGRHFIGYLERGNYTGLEISAEALRFARSLVSAERLERKAPRLIFNPDGNLRFGQFAGEAFDYILAQSVFTHIGPEHIKECFAHIGSVMSQASRFFFTIWEADRVARRGEFAFVYPFSFLAEVAREHGLDVTRRADFKHPRGQTMVTAFRREA